MLSIELVGPVTALARLQCSIAPKHFIDLLTLLWLDGRWQIRVWWKPFVTFIWYGGLLIALGGILAIAGRVKVDVKRRSAIAKGAERRADIEALGAASPVPAE